MEMEYRNLGRSGLKISALSFGSWVTFGNQVGNQIAEDCMKLAYDSGINFFDNAEAYAAGQSEVVMGEILKKMGWDRDTYILSSKVFWGGKKPTQLGLSRKHVTEACHAALKRLQVDYLDLYYCHRPDKNTPIEETVWAMHNLITQGKILYWGTSEWSAQEIQAAITAARQYNLIPPLMEQPQYNMLHRDRFEVEYDELYKHHGMGTTIWSPLLSGILTGKYNNGFPDDTRLSLNELGWLKDKVVVDEVLGKVRQLTAFAQELGTTIPHLALAWCLKNPNVSSVITGATKVSQLESNLKALDTVPLLTEEVMDRIEEILDNKPQFSKY